MQHLCGLHRGGDVRPLEDQARVEPLRLGYADHVRARRRDPDVARDVDHRLGGAFLSLGGVDDAPPLRLDRVEAGHVEPTGVDEGTLRVRRGDEHRPPLREEPRRVPSHRPEALHRHPRPLELDGAEALRDLPADRQPEAGGADLVQRDPPHLGGQADGAADLVLNPGHAPLVGAHVGARDVVGDLPETAGEGADQPLLLPGGHPRIAEDHGLAATVGEAGGRVLQRHGARKTECLFQAHVGGHAHPADRRPGRDVVDHQDRPEREGRLVQVDDLLRSQVVGETERVFHLRAPTARSRVTRPSGPPRRAAGRTSR
jgi:hypothetical protein